MTPQEQINLLQSQVSMLQQRLDRFERGDRFSFSKDFEMTKNIGVKIGTDANQKIGFWNATPIVQFSSPTGRQDTSFSSGINMTTGHRFNGNIGTDYYSVGDIVYVLKTTGLVKNQ